MGGWRRTRGAIRPLFLHLKHLLKHLLQTSFDNSTTKVAE